MTINEFHELLAMKKRFSPLDEALRSPSEEKRVQTLLSLADTAFMFTKPYQRYILGLLHSLQLDEESDLVTGYMTLIMWLLGDVTEEEYARHVFCQLEMTLPAQLKKLLIASFEQG